LQELLNGCYQPTDPDDAVGALHTACLQVTATLPLRKKLQHAVKAGQLKVAPGESLIDAAVQAGLLQPGEVQQLRQAEATRRKVIDVDDFAKEQLHPLEGRIR
jgi:acyl-CoA dehydrogenase